MVWIRPAYHRESLPDGDDWQFVNTDHYRALRLTESAPDAHGATRWELVAFRAPPGSGLPELAPGEEVDVLASVPNEVWARELLGALRTALASGSPLIDLSELIPQDERASGPRPRADELDV